MPRATTSRYFSFYTFDTPFFDSTDLKRVERSRRAELTDF